MTKRAWSWAAAVVAVAGLAAPAAADERIALSYTLVHAGFSVLSADIELRLEPAAYAVTGTYQTEGAISWLFPWKSVARTEGVIVEGKISPKLHRMDGEMRGRRRTVDLVYADGVLQRATVEPVREERTRTEVPEALRRVSIDPASAVIAAVHSVMRSGRCGASGVLPVFDGRRRYDLEFRDAGQAVLDRTSHSPYAGTAMACDYIHRKVAGFTQEEAENQVQVRTGRVYLAQIVPGAPPAPVRGEIEHEYGTTYVYLQSARRVTAAAATTAPPR